MRFLLNLVGLAFLAFAGWIAGSIYPAPAALVAPLNPPAVRARVDAELHSVDWARIRDAVSAEHLRALTAQATQTAVNAGHLITVEREMDPASMEGPMLAVAAIAPARPPGAAAAGSAAPSAAIAAFQSTLTICPRMTVSNAPARDAAGRVLRYAPIVNVEGVALAADPTRDACLASGFGARNGRLHKGVDYHNEMGGPVLAAGDGVIKEMKYRDDYGNMLLIDHGHGVYTRYAHLSAFAPALTIGAQVRAGQQIGLMGNTAAYPIPIHLHYEVLLGDYDNPKASFGLTPHSPFEFPAAG